MKKFLHPLIFLFLFIPFKMQAQCTSGEVEVTIIVHTDNWGSEVSWSLKGIGGSPTYASGGSYADGSEIHIEEKVCVPEGAELVFSISDSYGDGICAGEGDGYYTVTVYDFIYAQGCDYGSGETTTFTAEPAPDVNARFESININMYAVVGDNQIKGVFSNQGYDTITAIDVNWRVDNGSVQTHNLTGIEVPTYDELEFTHEILWNNTTAHETKNLDVWLSNPNGVEDEKKNNDSIAVNDIYILAEAVQTRVLIEHYTNAGCGPCANQNPVLESLSNTGDNRGKIAHIAYHTAGPGADPMYNFNNSYAQGSARANYYNITGVPTAIVNGREFSGSPASITQKLLDAEYEKFGLFKVVSEISNQNDSIIADIAITPLKDFTGENLKLFVVLVEDIQYSSPPGSNGETYFPDAMRYMLTGVNGESLSATEADQEMNIKRSMRFPDEMGTDLQLIVFIQNIDDKEVLMSYQQEVTATGIKEFSHFDSFKVYPNPAKENMHLQLNLKQKNSVDVKIFNGLGQLIKQVNFRQQEAGLKELELNVADISRGIYFVNITVGDETVTQKILITK